MLRPKPGKYVQFLSTPSSRRATLTMQEYYNKEEQFLSTPSSRRATFFAVHFHRAFQLFLSTPSARRATRSSQTRRCPSLNFYPRQPEEQRRRTDFYPRPPRGGRPRTKCTKMRR